MKTIKCLLVALLLMVCGTIVHAQSVVVYKTDGTKVEYNASEVKEVKYVEQVDYGYYSFKATSKAEIASLTAADFTKLTAATSEVPCGVAGLPVLLLPSNYTGATFEKYSVMDSGYGAVTDMKQGTSTTGTTKTINGVTYNVWYWAISTDASDNTKVRFSIK